MQTAVRLAESEVIKALDTLPNNAHQARRLVEFLSYHPKSPTDQVSLFCEISNVSDVVKRANAYIFSVGLMISCERPPIQHMDDSVVWVWSIYKVPESANDPVYDKSEEYNQDTP